MSYVLGVDLGTTTVAAATGDADRVEMVSLGERSVLAPAVVARRADGSLVTGDRAARRAATEPDRVAREVRRRFGDPTPVMLGERAEPATDLLAAMLREVLDRAVAVRGGRPVRVVLTHPASWGPYRRGLFEDVAAAAGLADAVTVPDPEAAVAQVAVSRGIDPAAPTAVLDLGGTSCEASVVRGGTVVGTPVALERLGGADLDEAVSAFVDEASGGLLAGLDPEDLSAGPALARFRADCVAAKEALSVDDEVGVPLLLPGHHLDLTLSRGAFEQRIAPVVTRAVETLRAALDAASVRPEDLAAVLLVGGSARVPLLARAVRAALAAPVVVEARPDHVVALGAVRRGAVLATPAGDEGEDGRTSLTPMRPREAVEDERTTMVRVSGGGAARAGAPAPGGTGPFPGPPSGGPPHPRPPAGPRPIGSGPVGSGPVGSGPVGSGPVGAGPVGAGPAGSGPVGPRPATGPFRAPGPYPPPYPGGPAPGGRPPAGRFRGGPPSAPFRSPAGPAPGSPPAPPPGSGRRRTLLVVGITVLVVVALVAAVVLLSGG